MLNKVKYGLREKIISSTKEGNAEISDAINVLQSSICDLSKTVDDLKSRLDTIGQEFVSNEYLLSTATSSKKRLLVCGFYGAKNLGDELMLQSLLKKIDAKKYDITIMLSRHVENDASCYSPYKVVHYPQRNDDILNIVHNYDVLVWGGGAILDDNNCGFNGAKTSLGYIFLKSSIAMINAEKPVLIFGVSTNQHLKDPRFINDLQFVVNSATYFSLRDTNSKKTLEEVKIDTKKVAVIDDLVISNLPVEQELKKISQDHLDIGMILINSWDHTENFVNFIKALAACVPDKKIKIHFIPFYDYVDLDINGYNEIAKNLDCDYVIEKYPENIDDLSKQLLGCDIVFSMRYHGVLIASLLNINTVAIDISKKHPHYYNKLNYIKEHYNPSLLSIPADDLVDFDKVSKILGLALKAQPAVDSKKIVGAAKKELDSLVKRLFN